MACPKRVVVRVVFVRGLHAIAGRGTRFLGLYSANISSKNLRDTVPAEIRNRLPILIATGANRVPHGSVIAKIVRKIGPSAWCMEDGNSEMRIKIRKIYDVWTSTKACERRGASSDLCRRRQTMHENQE